MANQDQTDITAITTTITTLQAQTQVTDVQGNKDFADVVFSYNSEKNRRAGSINAMPTNSFSAASFGGSTAPLSNQNVGARQW